MDQFQSTLRPRPRFNQESHPNPDNFRAGLPPSKQHDECRTTSHSFLHPRRCHQRSIQSHRPRNRQQCSRARSTRSSPSRRSTNASSPPTEPISPSTSQCATEPTCFQAAPAAILPTPTSTSVSAPALPTSILPTASPTATVPTAVL